MWRVSEWVIKEIDADSSSLLLHLFCDNPLLQATGIKKDKGSIGLSGQNGKPFFVSLKILLSYL